MVLERFIWLHVTDSINQNDISNLLSRDIISVVVAAFQLPCIVAVHFGNTKKDTKWTIVWKKKKFGRITNVIEKLCAKYATKRDANVSRHSEMSTVFLSLPLSLSPPCFVSFFSTSKIHSCEIRITSAYTAIIHSLPSFCLIWWWYLHPKNIWCDWNLNQYGVIPLVWVVMRFCLVNFNFGTVANFLYQILMFFVMCNLWMHHGNYILLQFSRMASIVFTCSNFWIGQNTTAVPLKRIDTPILLSSMNHLKCLHAFGTNEAIWLEKTFECTILWWWCLHKSQKSEQGYYDALEWKLTRRTKKRAAQKVLGTIQQWRGFNHANQRKTNNSDSHAKAQPCSFSWINSDIEASYSHSFCRSVYQSSSIYSIPI